MPRIILFTFASLVAALITGCSAIPMTQPLVALPVRLAEMSFNGDGQSSAVLHKQSVDMSANAQWQNYSDHLETFEGISLSMGVTNETGEAANPSPVQMRVYVSEHQHLTADTINQAEFVMEMTLPGGQRELRYDSGVTNLSPAAGAVMRDGRFFLYTIAYPGTAHVTARDIEGELKVRVSVL